MPTNYVDKFTLDNDQIIIKDSEARTLISGLDTRVSALENPANRKFILISDSYGARTNSWIDKFVAKLGLTSADYYSNAVGGYAFDPAGYNAKFITLLQGISAADPSAITDIIVVGGFNDRTQTIANINAAIQAFMVYANSTYPNATVWICGCGWAMNGEFITELNHGSYLEAYMNCAQYGANWIAGSQYVLKQFDRLAGEDPGSRTLVLGLQYVHPNDAGSEAIANCVINGIQGKATENAGANKHILLTASSNIINIGAGSLALDEYMINGMVGVVHTLCNMEINMSWNQDVLLGTIPAEGYLGGAIEWNQKCFYTVHPSAGANISVAGMVTLKIRNNQLYANANTWSPGGDIVGLYIWDDGRHPVMNI